MIPLLAALLLQAQDQISEQARAALGEAVDTVNGWVDHATALEGKLTELKENAEKIGATQGLLEAAVASREPAKLVEAVRGWHPGLADKLDTVADVEAALKKINPALGTRLGNKLDEALLVLADKARDLNGRALRRWKSSGLAERIDGALEGKGRLGQAIQAGRRIKAAWERVTNVKDKYDEILKDIEARFDPTARDAYAGLRAIHGILNEFAGDVPPPLDRVIGAYAEAVGAFLNGLQALETKLNEHARQMNLMRSIESTKDGILEELRRKFPDESAFDLTEIRTPDYLEGRFFHCLNDRYYLYTPVKVLYQLNGTLATLRRVAEMLRIVKNEVDPGTLAAAVPGFDARYAKVAAEYGPFLEACGASRAVFEPYLSLHYAGDEATAKLALEDVIRIHRWGHEEAMARVIFSEPDRDLVRLYGQILLYKVLVEVSVSGGEDFDPASLSVWAQPDRGSRAALRPSDGAWRALVRVDPLSDTLLVVGGSHAGEELRQVSESLPRTPARVSVALRVEPRPKEPPPAPPPPVAVDEILKDNETGPPAPPPDPPPLGPGAGSGSGEPDEPEQPPPAPPEADEIKDKTTGDTDPAAAPDETDAALGDRPGDLGDPGFDALLDKLLDGDRAGAEAELQRLTGCAKDRAKKEIDTLLGETRTTKDLGEKSKGARDPFTGPRPPPDGDFLRGAGLDPAVAAVPPAPGADPDAPRPEDLKPPPARDSDPNPFDRQRRDAAGQADDFLRRQGGAAERERRTAADQIRRVPMPTRGGMEGFDVGNAQAITITVWDNSAEDGDRVRIYVGGRVLVGDLTLTKAPQSFDVTLAESATAVRILALNEGTSPPNTASVKVSVNGRDLKTSGWNLKAHDLGDTLIRRSGP